MSNSSSDNKRIAKNTIVLYIKLVLSILIGLYTSRVILQALGASDYGLYTIVGGIVSMMNFLGITMTFVTYRYIVVEFLFLRNTTQSEPLMSIFYYDYTR